MSETNDRIPDEKFEQNKETITQDIDNTLQRVINDYSNHWKGVLGESIQNSYDAWVTNRFERKVIPTEQELVIEIEVDINRREFRWTDNAGGMPSTIFYERFAGLDTPGDEKLSGGAGGAYGRGFHVVAGAGDETYAETLHDGFHGGLVVRGAYQARYDGLDSLDDQGTAVTVKDCDIDLLMKLDDRKRIHEHIQARFQKMLEHDDVTVKVTIDGETKEVKPVDLSNFDILWEGDIEFEHNGEKKTLTDCVIYEKGGKDVPFDGMSMCKRHEEMGKPYMRVKQYRPREIRHLDKMFGFCDASILCPEYENNAHTGWVGGVLPAGIKRKFEEIEREEFIGGPTEIDQRDEIVNAALETLTDQWEDNPFDASADESDLEYGIEDENEGGTNDLQDGEEEIGGEAEDEIDVEDVTKGGPPDDDDDIYIEEEEQGNKSEEETEGIEEDDTRPVLRCQTKRRTFDAGETVDIRVFVDNPEGSGNEKYEVNGEVESESGNITDLEPKTISVQEGETSGGADGWQFDPSHEEGKFVFRADISPKGNLDEDIDSTNTYFYVGDTVQEDVGQQKATFIEDIEFFPDPDDNEFRHELKPGKSAFVLYVNPSHPEYRYAQKLDGKQGNENQITLLVRWGQEAVVNYLLIDRFEPELRERSTQEEEGDPLDEKFTGFVREQLMNELSEFSAKTYDRLI